VRPSPRLKRGRSLKASGRAGSRRAGEKTDELRPEPATAGEHESELSPAVRRLVEENNLDAAAIKGTGKDGRLTKEDVLSHVSKLTSQPKAVEPVKEIRYRKIEPGVEGVRREPMTRIRKRIAETLVKAQHTAAMLTTFNEVDMSGIFEIRKRYKESFTEKHGVSLGLMSFSSGPRFCHCKSMKP
jgi:2-oxoglutarate dehydrogenase E2 component (dihydrolipoamide succinyltransferase)